MKRFIILLFLLSKLLFSGEGISILEAETSPYLLQHKSNPVHWYAWKKDTFSKAKKENKPIFLSIGYSTCHWCHVMRKESFENQKIAQLLNKYFISIKVDREEMPHIDSFYQDIYLKIKGHTGGWPIHIFMTPDKEVFYLGNYIPQKQSSYSEGLDTLVPRLGKAYRSGELQGTINTIKNTMDNPVKKVKKHKELLSLQTLSESLKKDYDDIYSGFGEGRKFPESAKLSLMMDLAQITDDEELLEYSYEMLDTLALRGLYDHIEGGFFRYSVDAAWEIPHFEKMLYNQAELIPLYVRAYLLTGKNLYKSVVEETIEMLEKRYKKDNLYYSASDADTNHIEGEYFTFTPQEIAKTPLKLKENFEGKVHINFFDNKRPKEYKKIKEQLMKVRSKKEYPFIDKKINTAWNAMMIEALYNASTIDTKYAKKADKTLDALSTLMFKRGELMHQTVLGFDAKQKGLLEDYSFFISALIAGYQTDYSYEKLNFAEYLLNKAKSLFYKNDTWYLSDDTLNIKAGTIDKYYTSALAKMTQNIIKIAALKSSLRYDKFATKVLENLQEEIDSKRSHAPALAKAYLMQKLNIITLKSSLKNLKENRKKIVKIKYPFVLTKEEKYDDYLACTIRRCIMKDKNLDKLITIIENKRSE